MQAAGRESLTDAELIRRTLYGDGEAFGRLVTRYQADVYSLAFGIVRDWRDAQDVAQEAFIRAFTNLHTLRDRDRFVAWLKRLVTNVAINWLKAHRSQRFEPYDEAFDLESLDMFSSVPSPSEALQKQDLSERISRALAELPAKYRVALTMYHMDAMSYENVAAFLEVPLGTVKSLIHRARNKMKVALSAEMDEETISMMTKHKLPDDFAGKILANVPVLAYGRSGNTTFLGAFETAIANTDRPFDYDTLLVLSGLGFRLRYARRKDGRDWCTVGPVGQFPEEVDLLERTTGWALDYVADETDIGGKHTRTVKSIDADLPPVAYIKGDSGAVYGYEDGGNTVLVRCYGLGEGIHRLPFKDVTDGWGPFFLVKRREPLAPRDALAEALKKGVSNWKRGHVPAEEFQAWRGKGIWEYCFGAWAYDAWIADIERAEELKAEERARLLDVHGWMAYHLHDARLGCARYLSAHAGLLGDKAAPHLKRAAERYREVGESIREPLEQQHAFLISAEGRRGDASRWTPDMRRHECEILQHARTLEADAIGEIEKALE